jgi:transposase
MSAQRFSTSKQFVWQGVIYQVKRLLPASMVSIENLQTAEIRIVSFDELAQALFSGELRFVVNGEQSFPSHANPSAGLSDYPEHLRALAEYRFGIILPLLTLDPGQRSREIIVARVAEIKRAQLNKAASQNMAVSTASIYRWIRAYKHSGDDLRSLIGNTERQGGKQKTRLEETVETIVSTVIQDRYYVPEKVTADDIYLEVLLRIEEENRFRHVGEKLNAPSKVTIWMRQEN